MNWRQLIGSEEFKFCTDNRVDAVVNVLCDNIFGGSMVQCLKDRYGKMRSCFRGVPPNDERWRQDNLANDNSMTNDARAAMLPVPVDLIGGRVQTFMEGHLYFNWGHDLPVWMHCGAPKRKVMFIGQDPMRNGHEDTSHLYLSSPWGCHCESFRACDQTRNIFARLISELSCELYLTDYSKLFFTERALYRDSRKATPNAMERRQLQEHSMLGEDCGLVNILKKEISLYNPDLIVTSGGWVGQVPFFEGGFDPICRDRRCVCVGGERECDFITLYHPRPYNWNIVRPTFKKLGVATMSEYYFSSIKRALCKKTAR